MSPSSSNSRRPRRGGSAPRAKSHGPAIEPLHPTEIPPDIESFRAWNLGDAIQSAIDAMGIVTPSPIQKLAIGPVLEGRDVIAKAETGTGKTLAFGAPMMAKIDPARASVLGLVLCPTRELAEQVAKVLTELGKPRGIKVALIVGGEPSGPQVAALKAGSQVVVGTPGRVLDLYQQKFLSFPWTEFAVLDEADVMLEIGFIDDVKRILSLTPEERQTLLFSATFPPELLKLAREYTRNPAEVATASGVTTVDAIEQSWMSVEESDRPLALIRMIEQSEPDDVFLVFCDRRTDVDRLMRRLERMPFTVKALHGGYEQDARFRVMSAFRTGEVKALVATDVASRGLDVLHVTHVVNYGVPHDITDYTHRIGRTGRAGRKGRAITIVSHTNAHKWKRLERDARWPIVEVQPPEGRSSGRGRFTEKRDRPESTEAHEPRAPRRTHDRDARPAHSTREHSPASRERSPADPARESSSRHRDTHREPRESESKSPRPPHPARGAHADKQQVDADSRPARTRHASDEHRTREPRSRSATHEARGERSATRHANPPARETSHRREPSGDKPRAEHATRSEHARHPRAPDADARSTAPARKQAHERDPERKPAAQHAPHARKVASRREPSREESPRREPARSSAPHRKPAPHASPSAAGDRASHARKAPTPPPAEPLRRTFERPEHKPSHARRAPLHGEHREAPRERYTARRPHGKDESLRKNKSGR